MLLVAFGMVLGIAPNAFAGDFDILRGSQRSVPATFTRWSGFYVGGQIGYGNASADFSGATQIARSPSACANWRWRMRISRRSGRCSVPNSTYATAHYGGFVGYNTQWQDLILGFEANYNRSSAITVTAPVSPLCARHVGRRQQPMP